MVTDKIKDKIKELKDLNKFCEDYVEEHMLCKRTGMVDSYFVNYYQFEASRHGADGYLVDFTVTEDELLAILDTIGNFKQYGMSENIRWMACESDKRPPDSDGDWLYVFSLVVNDPDDATMFRLAHSDIFETCWQA